MPTEKTPPVIDSPEQLRRLSVGQLPAVCEELRSTLIRHLAVNPGHFASSMGAVELTVALHYVFNTPEDRIVWDVGHQAYAHKLLTGRRSRFSTNRTLNGISGFPTPEESEYDTFTAGHASNSISAALGMSVASSLKGDAPHRHVVAIIGDASICGGLAFEGLNNAANTPNNLIIILNDNEMSIDRNVGALTKYLSRINTSKRYNRIRFKCYRTLRKLGLVSDNGSITRFNNSVKSLLSHHQNIFEGLNIRYFGPIDGNDVEKVVRVLRDIKDLEGPKLLHLRTIKGCGYAPAVADPSTWHAPGRFDPATGTRKTDQASAIPKWQDVFGKTLVELCRANPKIVGITAAMSTGTSMSELQAVMPDRVFDVGISEGHAVTFAGGLAKEGMHPVVAIYSSFLQRAYDHIIHDVAILGLPVTLCIDRAGLVGEDGATHHGTFDLAYLRSIPGMIIASPGDAGQLQSLMLTATTHNGPMAIRYPRGKATGCDTMTGHILPAEIGRGRQLKQGTGLSIVTIGPIAANALKAIGQLEAEGITASLFDMVFLAPLDETIMQKLADSTGPIITVEDGIINGGLGSAVIEWLTDHGHDSSRVVRLGIPADRFIHHGSISELQHICGFDADGIFNAAKSALAAHTDHT